MVNSGKPVSPGAFAVNKISSQMLQTAPGAEKVIPVFLNFVANSCLASYNTEFDLGFLNNELNLLKLEAKRPTQALDILTLARNVLPGLSRYALWFVAQALEIKNDQKHRALADVELTLQVFNKLKTMVVDRGMTDFEQFLQLATPGNFIPQGLSLEKLTILKEAVSSGRKIVIEYFSVQDGRLSRREIIPRRLRQDAKYNYLVAYCLIKQEERTFKVENIRDIQVI